MTGHLFIVSGPSQVGKDTIVRRLEQEKSLHLAHIITNTTRPSRRGERNGVYINFLTEAAFQKLIDNDELLEWAIPYTGLGAKYGTPKKPVLDALGQGRNVILNIEVQGARQIKAKIPQAVLIFITAESAAEVKRRIFASPKMTLQQKTYRWQRAQIELKAKKIYTHVIINRRNQLEKTISEVQHLIKHHLASPSHSAKPPHL